MSPASFKRSAPIADGILSARDDAVQLSLNAWQIVGIIVAVLVVLGVVVGCAWRERRARLHDDSKERVTPGPASKDNFSTADSEGVEMEMGSTKREAVEQWLTPGPGSKDYFGTDRMEMGMGSSKREAEGTTEEQEERQRGGQRDMQMQMSPDEMEMEDRPRTEAEAEAEAEAKGKPEVEAEAEDSRHVGSVSVRVPESVTAAGDV
ncbi:hypothetical protein B0H19DRAFT_1377242 [Mycena capillaripes]|nr:hypothetical protein B0H19DRAFT_1377242 [Mycena capillaripes]